MSWQLSEDKRTAVVSRWFPVRTATKRAPSKSLSGNVETSAHGDATCEFSSLESTEVDLVDLVDFYYISII